MNNEAKHAIGNIGKENISKLADDNTHPCFSLGAAYKFSCIHLPVTPAYNIKCSYCNRKFDCINFDHPRMGQ